MSDQLPHEKGFHVSWDQIHRDSRALAWRLDGKVGPLYGCFSTRSAQGRSPHDQGARAPRPVRP